MWTNYTYGRRPWTLLHMPAYICIDFNFTKISAKHGRPKYILTPEKQATFNMVTSYYLQNSLETVERAHDFFFLSASLPPPR